MPLAHLYSCSRPVFSLQLPSNLTVADICVVFVCPCEGAHQHVCMLPSLPRKAFWDPWGPAAVDVFCLNSELKNYV